MSARDDQIRAGIEPLAPGERPRPLVIGALVCVGLAIANGVLALTGAELSDTSAAYFPVFAALLLVLAAGLWRANYWAALGFQGICTITAIYSFLSLLVASNPAAVVLSLAILSASGAMFWVMVRVMSRIQAPARE